MHFSLEEVCVLPIEYVGSHGRPPKWGARGMMCSPVLVLIFIMVFVLLTIS